ncbi:MAG: small multi-drug export protein [Lentisphaeria bacterium]|nr:small multi-drug export protein [Candidatus Neomarinimicrobiota bacterium]MCF7842579.1 small multi-drug export protein [Lentisphaeria bacterium]
MDHPVIHNLLAIVSIIIAQFILGKKAAFPLGLVLGFSAWSIAAIVILCDMVLMFILLNLFAVSISRLKWMRLVRKRFEWAQEWLAEGRWTRKLIPVGWLGVVAITAIPLAGGVWSGVALSRTMAMTRNQSIITITLGIILGCAIFLFAALGVMHVVSIPSEPVMIPEL